MSGSRGPQLRQEAEQRRVGGRQLLGWEIAPKEEALLFVICCLLVLKVEKLDHPSGNKYKSHGRKTEDARMKRQLRSSMWQGRREGGKTGWQLEGLVWTFASGGAAV